MKEANYNKFRQILSESELFGDDVLRIMKQNSKDITLSCKAFDLVYEGLWDLYCKKSQSPDLTPKKLEGFI